MSVSDELVVDLAEWVNVHRSNGCSEEAIREALLRAGLAIPDGGPSFFPADMRLLSAEAPRRGRRKAEKAGARPRTGYSN